MRRKQSAQIAPVDTGTHYVLDDEIDNIDDEIYAILNPGVKAARRRAASVSIPAPAPVSATSSPAPSPPKGNKSPSRTRDEHDVPLASRTNFPTIVESEEDDEEIFEKPSIKMIIAKQKNDQEIKKLAEKEKAVAVTIKNVFTALTGQIEEYRQRFQDSTEKLWTEADRNALLEERIEALEEEKMTLIEANIRARDDVKTGKIFIPVVQVTNTNTVGKDLRGEEIRRALLFDDYEENGVLTMDVLYGNGAGGFASAVMKALIIKLTPFKGDIRKITSQFGSSVASFFIFYRFIFLQSILIALIAAVFTVFHIIRMVNRGGTVQSVIISRGLLPQFMMYSTFDETEAVYYSAVVIGGLFITFCALLDKYIREDLISKEAEAIAAENTYTYGNDCFCAWDFSVASKVEADDYCGSLTQVYCLLLSETKDNGMKDSRSSADLFSLYCRRFVGFTLYLIVQSISFILIILVTLNENKFSQVLRSIAGLSNIAQVIPPALLTTINYLTPDLFTRITDLERWDNVSTEINMLLFRMYCSSTLNLLLLAFSYALLANPFLLGDQPYFREALAIKPSSTFTCRMDQAANGLFTLVIFTFIIKGATMMIVPMMMIFRSRLTLTPEVKTEFAIAQRIVETLNLISVVFLSFPYAPLSLIFLPFFLYSTLKWEKYTTLKFQSKPKRPWKAQKAGTVFTMFYLVSLILIGIPSGIFFLATSTFPKQCQIQDDNIRLCKRSFVGDICVTNDQSPYYPLYGDPSSTYYGFVHANDYPAGICEKACGPYVGIRGGNIEPFIDAIYSNEVLAGWWNALFYYPYLPWALTVILFIVLSLRSNSVDVLIYHSLNKEKALNNRILKLELEQKRQAKIIGRMRSIERDSNEVDINHILPIIEKKETEVSKKTKPPTKKL